MLINQEGQLPDGVITADIKDDAAKTKGYFISLNALLSKMSPLNPEYLSKKQSVFQKIAAFVEKFKGVGGHGHV